MPERVVLAYSGGLDTSVAVRWLIENEGVEVVAVAVDVGQAAEKGGEDWDAIRARAPPPPTPPPPPPPTAQASTPRMAVRRCAAWRHTTERGPSSTDALISSPR